MLSFRKTASFDILTLLKDFYQRNRQEIKLFLILFFIDLLVYGQKIFFVSYPADDYMRFWGDDNTRMLITHSARWAQALLNQYVFTGPLQIMPYLHGLFGILAFTWMGLATARFFKMEHPLEKGMTALLVSISPSIAHNLYFSTNITAWLTLPLGIIGFIWFYQRSWLWKIFGLALLIVSIANYQTILQIIVIMLIVRALIDMREADDTHNVYRILLKVFMVLFWIVAAYYLSFHINELFLKHYHLHEGHRLSKAEHHFDLKDIMAGVASVYHLQIPYKYFAKPQNTLLWLSEGLVLIQLLGYYLFRRQGRVRLLSITLLSLAAFSLPILLHLPAVLGLWIPMRAYLPEGWLLGGLFALSVVYGSSPIRTVVGLTVSLLVFIHIYYIALFYDACRRQTEADIRRANMIVQRIRLDKNYTNEPMAFYILGQKKFNVPGWDLKWQQPFDSYWAKYKIFRYFTDFQFHPANQKEKNRIVQYIAKQGSLKKAYPAKGSVVVHDGVAMLILDPAKINITIEKMYLLRNFPDNIEPIAEKSFEIFLKDNTVYFRKQKFTQADIHKKFFFRIYPANPRQKVNGRVIYPFQTWDFNFDLHGEKTGGECRIAVKLPDYPVKKIYTGQFAPSRRGIDWETTIDLNDTHIASDSKVSR